MVGDIFIENEKGEYVRMEENIPNLHPLDKTGKGNYIQVRLYPTSFYLHVFLYYETKEDLKKEFDRIFPKEGWEGYFQNLGDNEISFVENLETESVGKTIIMVLKEPTLQILVHEIVHVLNHLNSYVNIEIGPQAQEWNAYFQDYLFEQIAPCIKDVVKYIK